MKLVRLIKTSALLFFTAFLLSSCGKTVMTIKAPSSPEIESELTMILDNIILDDAEPSVSYRDGLYQLKLNRELAPWERMALRGILDKAVKAEGFEEIPSMLKLRITEEDSDVLAVLNIEHDQVFECHFSASELSMVKGSFGDQEVYEIGAVLHMNDELPELEYEIGLNDGLSDEMGEAMQSLMDTMRSFGPMSARYELSVSDGKRDVVIESTLEPMSHDQFISAGVVQTAMINPYALYDSVDYEEGLEDFFTNKGFSEAFVCGLLFPALSRDAADFNFPEKKS